MKAWPQSLFGRLMLILCLGLLSAHLLSWVWITVEREKAARSMMVYYLARDVASSVAILERLERSERPSWLGRLERENYRYLLGHVATDAAMLGQATDLALAQKLSLEISQALGADYPLRTSTYQGALQLQLFLHDGTALLIQLRPAARPASLWLPLLLALQLLILLAVSYWVVRLLTRPLEQLAKAADGLHPFQTAQLLPENGPLEIAKAARAFNAMQRRMTAYLAERLHILAAISHDLQTPITRMRLRADLLENEVQKDKMLADLAAMQNLVEQGIRYAKSGQALTEATCRTDLNALLESLVFDYQDAGQTVKLMALKPCFIHTQPHALRRVLLNLLDNAIKFACEAELDLTASAQGEVVITVLDRGPGIAEAELQNVLKPFYRLEESRNRDTGGSGLGLAIALQLATALGARLILSNRTGGGLQAQLLLVEPTYL
jgi:signal transduction histidine kinase